MSLRIRMLQFGEDPSDFLRVADEVFRGDPAWVAPLEMELRERLDPAKNPFFQHAEGAAWVAYRDGRPVGRITAQVDQEHLRLHGDEAGFFGFFQTVDDEEVAHGLLRETERWLAERGMRRMRGPFSLSINEESGMLVEGFSRPPYVMMPHDRPWQAGLAESYGLRKVKDLYAWEYDSGRTPKRVLRAWEQVQQMSEVTFRSISLRHLARDVRVIMEIFNDAWSENWGFVPATEAEVDKLARDLLLVLDPHISFIVEIEGEPAAMCVCLPNVNESLAGLGSRPSPLGWARLLWRLKVRRPSSARLMLLGLKRRYWTHKRYGVLSAAMFVELEKRAVPRGYLRGELGWTLEDNRRINTAIRLMGARRTKRYRIFEKPIGEDSAEGRGTREEPSS